MSSTVDQMRAEIGDLESYLAGLSDAQRTGADIAAYRSRLEKLRAELATAERTQAARPAAPASNPGASGERMAGPGSSLESRTPARPSAADHEVPLRDPAVGKLAKSIGSAARQARAALELTQEDAAERLGVSVDFYARIERGNSLPSVPTLARMVAVLGISADVLLGRIEFTPGSAPTWSTAASPTDAPEVRRVGRMLRRASPGALRLVAMLLRELDRQTGGSATDAGSEDAVASNAAASDPNAED